MLCMTSSLMSTPKVIAEVSANHCGSVEVAGELIKRSAAVGAHYVKFQLYNPISDIQLLPGIKYPACLSQQASTDSLAIQSAMLELDWLPTLQQTALDNQIDLIYSCSALDLLEIAKTYSTTSTLKIASCDATNLELIKLASFNFDKLIISTGAITLDETRSLSEFILNHLEFKGELVFLYCVSEYPVNEDHLNLEQIKTIQEVTNLPSGYSDHCPDLAACFASLAYSPAYIEKHIQLQNTNSVDSPVSCTVEDLSVLIRTINFLNNQHFDNSELTLSQQLLRRSPFFKDAQLLSDTSSSSSIPEYIRPGIGMQLTDSILAFVNKDSKSPRQLANYVNSFWT